MIGILIHQKARKTSDYDRIERHFQALGVHLNFVDGGRSQDRQHDSAENFVFGPPESMQKVQEIRSSCLDLHHQQKQPWEGVPSPAGPPSTSIPAQKQSVEGAPQPQQDQGSRLPRSQKVKSTQAHNRMNPVHPEARSRSENPADSNIGNRSDKPSKEDPQPRNSSQAEAPGSLEANDVMTEQASFPELKPIMTRS